MPHYRPKRNRANNRANNSNHYQKNASRHSRGNESVQNHDAEDANHHHYADSHRDRPRKGDITSTPIDQLISKRDGRLSVPLPESLKTFMQRASSLLSSSHDLPHEMQFQFAHSIQQQFVTSDDKERLLLLSDPKASQLIDKLILWSNSDLFYEFLGTISNLYLYMAQSPVSCEALHKIMVHLEADIIDNDITQQAQERARLHWDALREAIRTAKDEDLYVNRESARFLTQFFRHEIAMNNLDEVQSYVEYFQKILADNPEWFLGEVPWLSAFTTFLESFFRMLEEMHCPPLRPAVNALWDSVLGFHVELRAAPDTEYKLEADDDKIGCVRDMCVNLDSSILLKYFFEVVSMRCADAIFEAVFAGKLERLMTYREGIMISATLLTSLGLEQFKVAFDELIGGEVNELTKMWAENRKRNTVIALTSGIAKYAMQDKNLDAHQKDVVKVFVDLARGPLIEYLLSKINNPKNRDTHAEFDRFGVKLVEALLHFKPSAVKPVLKDLESLNNDYFARLCTDKWGSFVVDEWIKVLYNGAVGNSQRKRKVLEKFEGSVVRIVTNPYGSRVFDTLLTLSNPKHQVPLLEEYIRGEGECRKSKFARIIFSKFFLGDFKVHPDSWVRQQQKTRKVSTMFSNFLGENEATGKETNGASEKQNGENAPSGKEGKSEHKRSKKDNKRKRKETDTDNRKNKQRRKSEGNA